MQETFMPEKSTSKNTLLCLTLPIPPSINEQYATVGGHRVSSLAARRFKQQVRDTLRSLERQGVLHADLLSASHPSYLALFLDSYFAHPLKRHLDVDFK